MGTYYDSKTGKTYNYTGSFANGTAVFTEEIPPTAGGNYSSGGGSGGGGSTTPKPTITGKLDSVPTGSQSTILAGENKGTTFTEENITSVKPSSSSTPVTPTDSTAGNTNNTNNILTTPLAETIISAVTGENKKPTNTNPLVRPAQQYAQSVVKTQQQQQDFYNPAHFVVSEAPKNSSYLQEVRDDDIALSNSEYGVPSGIYRFDNKQEAQKFMKTLSDEYNYDFGDEETRFYDEKTGNFLGFLGAEAFPYAIVIPESRDSEIQSFWNTGGSKGSSPAK